MAEMALLARPERDFQDVTEVPGLPVSRVQLERTYHRYRVASSYAAGADVLEVACGAGLGLRVLGRTARRLVAGDYTSSNLRLARAADGGVELVRLDGQALPFASERFDLVVMLEAIYYLPDARRAVAECHRVLRGGGRMVISTVNPAWPDFAPSIRSTRYFDPDELRQLLEEAGFEVEIFGAFAEERGPRAVLRSLLRRLAARLGLIPGSLRAKATLKRFFYGEMRRQPASLDPDHPSVERLVAVPPGSRDTVHSILYAVATRA